MVNVYVEPCGLTRSMERIDLRTRNSNPCNPQAVAMKREISHMLQVVGHVPRGISSICSIFIRRGGIMKCLILAQLKLLSYETF